MFAMNENTPICIAKRYTLYGAIAVGGMATVHIGRLHGAAGFFRTVAIKRLHPDYARDPEFVSMFVDEARLTSRIHHPNVIHTLDVVAQNNELFLIMEYVPGEALANLMRLANAQREGVPHRIAATIMLDVLAGLHAAHESVDENGRSLELVHRDVSPQNIQVGMEGLSRVLDFGVAKSTGCLHDTRMGVAKGKLPYMAPEQIDDAIVSRQADIFGASVVLWELLTGCRLFRAKTAAQVLAKVMTGEIAPPSSLVPHLPPGYDTVVLRGLERNPEHRYGSALAMAEELEACCGGADRAAVAAWINKLAGPLLERRSAEIARVERDSGVSRLADLRAVVDRFSATRPSRVDVNRGPYNLSDMESTRASADLYVAASTSRSRTRALRKGTAGAIGALGVVLAGSLLIALNRIPAEAHAIGSDSSTPMAVAAQLAPAVDPKQQELILPIEHSEADANSSQRLSEFESTTQVKTTPHRPSRTEPSKTSTSGVPSPFRNLGGRL